MKMVYIVFYQSNNYIENIVGVFETLEGARSHLDYLVNLNSNNALYHIKQYQVH